ncbi:winged helix-turn-helix domain-containing protein [Halotalea alkalilenta]|uniref:Cytoplasmic protein n=1 Tax=Halotalea alkalilenta TaxID=376489 RepID=A0A172YBV8_9GAMM|nr:crosslink repair DNA glycosylase YcaQ family protein [Halotalea alkalilenta]ANF56606.1 cytoplasmic protein [Halotalea alkalilenta]
MARERLSASQARRLALSAQGFATPRPQRCDRGHLRRMLERIQVLQIDSVNAVVRAHYLPLFSRLGDYPRQLLDEAAWSAGRHRQLFEYWGHEASLLPLELYPAMRWRMLEARAGVGIYKGLARFGAEHRDVIERVLGEIERHGARPASALNTRQGPAGPWWDWSDEKQALEWLFAAGLVTVSGRRGFERLYDLPERVLPEAVLARPEPDAAAAQRELVERSARALGVATQRDLRDYYRLSPKATQEALQALVEEGRLRPVEVEGWRGPGYLVGDPVIPRRIETSALLAPFDPLIWDRARTERLFGFHYRLEIYVPEGKRRYGYYVLPFLFGERMVARLDLRTRRREGILELLAVHQEPDLAIDEYELEALALELERLADWLELPRLKLSCPRPLASRLVPLLQHRR